MSKYYIDRFKSTGNTRLLPINGKVFVKCIVQGRVNGRIRQHKEVGTSGMKPLRNRTYFHDAFTNAQMNAMYQFKTRFGASGEKIIKILDYWIDYPKINGYRAKRINRNNKYYTYIFDSNGKIKTYSRWNYARKQDTSNLVGG